MKTALVDGSRYGWRGALVFPAEYFDLASGYTLAANAGTFLLAGTNATLTYTPAGGTVGDDTAGGDTFPTTNNRAILSDFVMPGAGDGVTGYLRFDVTSLAGANAKFLVYADSGGVPGALLYASAGQAVPAGGGILTYSVSVPGLTASQVVWLGGVTDSSGPVWQVDSSGGLSRMEGMNYASPNATWTQSGTAGAQVNAWMDYTSGGGGSYSMPAATGAFALAGTATGLLYARRLQADSGTFALAGTAANLVYGRTMTAASGSYAMAGTDIGMRYTRLMPANTAVYDMVGSNASLLFNRNLAAQSGAYAVAGSDAGFMYNRRLAADTGAYTIAGTDATLVYTPVGGYTLVAETGTYALTGGDAGLIYTRNMAATTGSYAFVGADVTISYTPLPTNYQLDAEAGPFFFYGTMATLVYSGAPIADHGVTSALTYPITHSIVDWAH